MSETRTRQVARRGLAASAVLALVVLGPTVSPVSASPQPAAREGAGNECLNVGETDAEVDETTVDSMTADALQIGEVHRLLRSRSIEPGEGVRVAVVDSRISPKVDSDVDVERPQVPFVSGITDKTSKTLDYHGTTMAGLIGGAAVDDPSADPDAEGRIVGFAPAATVIDVPVYDIENAESGDDGKEGKTLGEDDYANLVAGLDFVAGLGDVDIVNVSLVAPESDELGAAIKRLTDDGTIVVAPTGDRPMSDKDPFHEQFESQPQPGEDAAAEVFPAGYAPTNPLVVAVSSTVGEDEDPQTLILPNSAVTVAAPTIGAVSYAVNGATCQIVQPSTSYAAAEVSGVLALLKSGRKSDTSEQLVARLKETAAGPATGTPSQQGKSIGYGLVQPLAALTSRVNPSKSGEVERFPVADDRPTPVTLPEPEPDRLRSTRRNAVWWGLGGGGALVIALLLRPVLARRRPRP